MFSPGVGTSKKDKQSFLNSVSEMYSFANSVILPALMRHSSSNSVRYRSTEPWRNTQLINRCEPPSKPAGNGTNPHETASNMQFSLTALNKFSNIIKVGQCGHVISTFPGAALTHQEFERLIAVESSLGGRMDSLYVAISHPWKGICLSRKPICHHFQI